MTNGSRCITHSSLIAQNTEQVVTVQINLPYYKNYKKECNQYGFATSGVEDHLDQPIEDVICFLFFRMGRLKLLCTEIKKGDQMNLNPLL